MWALYELDPEQNLVADAHALADQLVTAIVSGDESTARAAHRALRQLGRANPRSVARLAELLQPEQPEDFVAELDEDEVKHTLLCLGPEGIRAIRRWRQTAEMSGHRMCRPAQGPADPRLAVLRAALKVDDPAVQTLALRLMMRSGPAAHVAEADAARLLQADSMSVRSGAAGAVGMMAPRRPETVRALAKTLRSPSTFVKLKAIDALSQTNVAFEEADNALAEAVAREGRLVSACAAYARRLLPHRRRALAGP
ncbi:MAG: hypothetical protein ACOC93_02105 [Planctomycetota bacterium]